MTYFYPNNLASRPLFVKYWNLTDLVIIAVLFILSVLNVIVFGKLWLFILLALYVMFSAKIVNNSSLTKLAILYGRFLLTDILVYYWR